MVSDRDREARAEWEAGRLETLADEAAWALHRDEALGIERRRTATGEMMYVWATDRAAVEAACPDGHEWRAANLPFDLRDDDGDAA